MDTRVPTEYTPYPVSTRPTNCMPEPNLASSLVLIFLLLLCFFVSDQLHDAPTMGHTSFLVLLPFPVLYCSFCRTKYNYASTMGHTSFLLLTLLGLLFSSSCPTKYNMPEQNQYLVYTKSHASFVVSDETVPNACC